MACGFTINEVMGLLREQITQHALAAKASKTRPKMLNHAEFMDTLLNYNFAATGVTWTLTPKEANDIVGSYFGTYKKLFKEVSKGQLGKASKNIDAAIEDMDGGRVLSPAEMTAIHRMLDRAFLLDGSARDIEVEKVADYIKKAWPAYNHAKLQAAVFLTPLLSPRFLIKAAVTNATVVMMRGIVSMIEGGKASGTKQAWQVLKDVLQGGLPTQTVVSTEVKKDSGKSVLDSRAEEYKVENTDSILLRNYARVEGFYAFLSGRANNSIDSFGMSYVMEKHLKTLFKNQVKSQLKATRSAIVKLEAKLADLISKNAPQSEIDKVEDDLKQENKELEIDVNKEVYKKLFPKGKEGAYERTIAMYKAAGYSIVQSGKNTDTQINENSPKFKRSVFEKEREGRNTDAVRIAHKMALVDFFKQPMGYTSVSRNGFDVIDEGVGGVIAAAMRPGAQRLHSFTKNQAIKWGLSPAKSDWFADKVQLFTFGFINGGNAFIEQVLETTPYGYIKAGLMDRKGKQSDDPIYAEMRKRDLIKKATYGLIANAILFGFIKAINEYLCDGEGNEITANDASHGLGISVCGHKLPVWLAGMMGPMQGILNLMTSGDKPVSIEKITATVSLIGFRFDDPTLVRKISDRMSANNTYEKETANRGLWQHIMDGAFKFGMGDIFPSSAMNDVTSLVSVDSQVKPTIESGPEMAKWSFFQAIGIKDMMLDASGDDPIYDYRGRKVFDNYWKYSVNDGIKYDKLDDFINNVGVDLKLLYNGPYRRLFTSSKWIDTDKEPRYPTSDEYSKNLLATGKIFDEFMKNNYERLGERDKDIAKHYIEQQLKDLETISRDAMEETTPDEYESYMRKRMKERSKETIRKNTNKKFEKNLKKQKAKAEEEAMY